MPRSLATRSLACAAIAAVGWTIAVAPGASAASYRYWTYWQGGAGGWTFASAGPASTVPADGSVEGWRFAVTSAAGQAGDAPAADADFMTACAGATAPEGMKRVALVVDSGSSQQAPPGEVPPDDLVTCVVIEADATGYDVLRSALQVRTQDGLICGIAGYPADECAPVVDDPPLSSPTASSPNTSSANTSSAGETTLTASSPTAMDGEAAADGSGGGTPWITVGVLAVLAAVGGFWWWRRA